MEKQQQGFDWTIAVLTVAVLAAFITWIVLAGRYSDTAHNAGFLALLAVTIALTIAENIRRDGRMDEMELAAARFGTRWALVASIVLVGLAAFLPPIRSLIAGLGEELAISGNKRLPPAVQMFVLGVCLSVVVQQLAARLLSALWTLSKR